MKNLSLPKLYIQEQNVEEIYCLQAKSERTIIVLASLFFIVFILVIVFCKIDKVIKITGIVKTEQNVSIIKNILPGNIEKIYYSSNQFVNKDQVLYTLDSRSIVNEINLQEITLKEKITKYNESKNLYELIMNDTTICLNDSVRKEYEIFESKLKRLEKEIEISEKKYNRENSIPKELTTQIILNELREQYELTKLYLEEYKKEIVNSVSKRKEELANDIELQKKTLLQCQLQLENTIIKSPIDGFVIINSKYNEKDFLNSNESLLRIVPCHEEACVVDFYIKSSEIAKVEKGQTVKCRFPAYPYNEFNGLNGVITSIDADSTIEQNVLLYKATCKLSERELKDKHGKKYKIKPGIDVYGRIVLDRKTIISFLLDKLDLSK